MKMSVSKMKMSASKNKAKVECAKDKKAALANLKAAIALLEQDISDSEMNWAVVGSMGGAREVSEQVLEIAKCIAS